jgi:ubiquinone/menaquinone biosynthesis C-methylase UbiE
MAKSGEIAYLNNLGEAGVWHSVHKPFSDSNCADYLAQFGAILNLLPPPPARLLDLGCGTGWTSLFFARRGYQVVGVDISPDMIRHAGDCGIEAGLDNLDFVVGDYEELDFAGEFDAAVFYDSLHHAVDEEAALRAAYRALKPGGICVTSEPGEGHHESVAAREAVLRFNVTEKDMPPHHIIALGRRVGFRGFHVYPHAIYVHSYLYRQGANVVPTPCRKGWSFRVRRLFSGSLLQARTVSILRLLKFLVQARTLRSAGIVVLQK